MRNRIIDHLYLILLPLLFWIIAGVSVGWVISFWFLQLGNTLSLQNLRTGATIEVGIWAGFMFLITVNRESREFFFEGEDTPLSGIVSCLVGLMLAIPALLIFISGGGLFWGFIWWWLRGYQN